ncbi:hypothetical protein LCGC14_0231170 [marine sediment metagenome]|uniref:Uncharacterized protein n=1 Tax=marine sediment metagenome TaxID=412755 RepID=A0A0F9U9Y7_9ZZZZ
MWLVDVIAWTLPTLQKVVIIHPMKRNQLIRRTRRSLSPQARKALDECNAKRKGNPVANSRFRSLIDSDRVPNREDVPDAKFRTQAPIFITRPNDRKKFIEHIKAGLPVAPSCRAAGISYQALMGWLKLGEAGKNKDYYDFFMEVRQAEAEAEITIAEEIRAAGKKQWQANAWFMERRWADRWGRREAIRQEISIKSETTITVRDELSARVVNDPRSRELARAILEGKILDGEFERIDSDGEGNA